MMKAWLLDEMFRFDRAALTSKGARVNGVPETRSLRKRNCLQRPPTWRPSLEMAG